LDPSVIGPNLAQNGLAQADPGQAASLTSTNNFINFCLGKTITNGQQVQEGSCNPVPMGDIPPKANQPSCKFVFPKNLDTIAPNTPFTVQLAIKNLETGNFVNPQTNYFGAPQQLNAQNIIIGHSHIVIEKVNGITDTQPLDPTQFSFFLGLNAAAQGGILTADVSKGLDAGTYRCASINTNANHSPVVGAVAQHGSFDDAVYFTVGDAAAQQAAADIAAAAGANNGAAAGAANNGTAAAGAANNGAAAAGAAGAGAGAGAAGAGAGAAGAGAGAAGAGAGAGAAGGAAGGNNGGQNGGKNRKGGRNGGRNGRRSFAISRAL
jgi:hypothetical protein